MKTHSEGGRMRYAMLVLVMLFAGCTDTEIGRLSAYGEPHLIVQFSGGVEVGRWCSTGRVLTPGDGAGWQFTALGGELMEVSGDVQITVNASECR